MKPTILVDMDGPLADFDLHYWRTVKGIGKQSGYLHESPFDIARLEDQRHRFLSDHITDQSTRRIATEQVNAPGWFAGLPPVEGAVAAVQTLAEVADVWVCSKPLEANPTCRDEKAAWLTEHMGEGWDKRLILSPDKSMIHGDLLLDDAIKSHWVPSASWAPVVYSAPFNGAGTRFGQDWPRFEWSEGLQRLLGLVESRS